MVVQRYLGTPLDLPIALFLVSALIGVWASYDPATSWRKFAMIVAAVALYYLLVALRTAPQLLEAFVWLLLFGCCALTLYFVTQHDYAAQPGKFGLITAIGLTLNRIAPQLGLHVFDPNITSGALEIGLPLAVALAASQKEKAKKRNRSSLSPGLLASLSVSAIIAFGLLMTTSRAAWLALGIVAGIAALVFAAKDVLRRYALPIGVIAVLIALIVVVRLGDSFVLTVESILGTIPAGDTAISRVELWGQAWGLVQDYYFTGSGLGVFPMILSTYALLIDVPFLTHVHNLFLQIWLEQGLLGIVAFMWLDIVFYAWVWTRRYSLSLLAYGGVAVVTAMLLHGMVDVLLYSSRGLPLLLVPFAVTIASRQVTVSGQQIGGQRAQDTKREKAWNPKPVPWNSVLYVVFPAAFCLLLLSSSILHPSSLAATWYANLGSVGQTRAELGQYHWPDRLVETVRSDPRAVSEFQSPISNYKYSLAQDAENITANQRLGAIASALEEYDAAQRYLSAAQVRDRTNTVTLRLMADTYLAMGLKADACRIAEQAMTRGTKRTLIFPPSECEVK